MNLTFSDRFERALFLMFGWAVAVVPIVYFHNGLVTEYYFSKTVWGNLFIPLTVMLLVALMLREGKLYVPRARTMLPLLALCAWALLSLAWTTNPYKGFELMGKIAAGPVAYMGTLWYVRSRQQTIGMLHLITWTMVGVVIYGFFQYFEVFYLPKDQYDEADPSTTIGLTNFVVEYMMCFLLTPALLMVLDNRRWVRMLLLFATGAILVYLIIARNRAGMLGFLAEILLLVSILVGIAWKQRERFNVDPKKLITAALIVVIAVGAILGGTTVGRRVSARFLSLLEPANVEQTADLGVLDTFLVRARRDASVRFRIETWYQCLKNMFPDNPITGVGLANLEVEFPRYYTNFLEDMTIRNNTRVVRSHNEYIQVLVDMGLVGFVLFMWLLVQLVRNIVRSFKNARGTPDLLLWAAVNIGFVGFAVEMFFAFPLQVPSSSLVFFVVLALSEVTARVLRTRDSEDVHTAYRLWELKPQWKLSLAWVVLALFAVGTVRLEWFTYDALTGEVRNKEARVYKRYKRWDEAHSLLTDAIQHYPWMEGYYYDRAVVLMQQKKLDEALEDLQMTAKLVPNYAMGRKQIGMLASELGKTELAVNEFTKTMEIYASQRPQLTELIAKTALRGNRPELAVKTLEETMAMGQGDAGLRRLLADAYLVMNKPGEALATYETMREQGQWDRGTRANYGMALLQNNRVSEAEQQLRSLLNEDADYADGWLAYGRVLAELGRYDEAQKALSKTIALKPEERRRIRRDPNLARHAELKEFLSGL